MSHNFRIGVETTQKHSYVLAFVAISIITYGQTGGVRAVLCLEFYADIDDVRVNGANTNLQARRNFLVTIAVRDETHNLTLTRGQDAGRSAGHSEKLF
jgi:hypothetical protein